MRLEMRAQARAQRSQDRPAGDRASSCAKAAPLQRGHDCVDVRAIDLPVRRAACRARPARRRSRSRRCAAARDAMRACARWLRCTATSAGPRRMPGCNSCSPRRDVECRERECSARRVGAASTSSCATPSRDRDLLDGNDAIAACGQHRARHHFDAVFSVAQATAARRRPPACRQCEMRAARARRPQRRMRCRPS